MRNQSNKIINELNNKLFKHFNMFKVMNIATKTGAYEILGQSSELRHYLSEAR